MSTASELKTALDSQAQECAALLTLWSCIIGPAPEPRYVFMLLRRYGYAATLAGVERTGAKFAALGGQMSQEYQLRYCASVAKNHTARAITQ